MERRHARLRRCLSALVVAALLGGCPHRFDPRAAPVQSSPDPAADAAFRAARSQYDAGALDQARSRFEAFVAAYQTDALRPVAETFLGRIAFARREFARAKTLLAGPASAADAAVADPARYLLGLTLHQLGQEGEACRLLRPFAGRVEGDDAAELHGTLADAEAKLGEVAAALGDYEQLYRYGRDHERAYVREQAQALAAKPTMAELAGLYAAVPRRSLAAAVLGQRLALSRVEPREKAGMLEDIRDARGAFGLNETEPGTAAASESVEPRLVGCLVPLTGKARAVGEAALKGALLGASGLLGSGADRFDLAVRDTGGDPVRTEQAVRELWQEGVIAVVGPIDRRDAAAAARTAEGLGLPLIALDVAEGGGASGALHAMPTPAARAVALARHAAAAGVREVAIVAPDNAYGQKVSAAFAVAARQAGMQVTADERYEPQATSFAKLTARLKTRRVGALFVPDRAAVLELLAPALARAGLWSRPAAEAGHGRGGGVLLLSTAEGLGPRLVRTAGRYVQGAVLAPGFYADLEDERLSQFAGSYRDAYGAEPGLFEAFGYDAIRAIRAVVGAGARTRADVRLRLARDPGLKGVTGQVTFGPDGERADAPLLYVVDGERIRLERPAGRGPQR